MSPVTYPCYVQQRDRNGQWYWIYYGRNGEELARSSSAYEQRSECTQAINALKSSLSSPTFYRE